MKNNMLTYFGFLLFIVFVTPCAAQQNYQYAEGFKYVETVKNTSKADADLPIIVGFHYSSSTPHEAENDYDQVMLPVRIIIPQGNFRKREGYSYFPVDYYAKDSVAQTNIAKQTVDSIAIFLKAIIKKYNRKPIVAGFSQGGDISFLLAIYYPELIQAAFPLAGFIHRQRFTDAIEHAQKRVPIYVYQGEADKIVSVKYSRSEVLTLSKYFAIEITTYPGVGHDFSHQMKKDYANRMMTVLVK